MVRRSFSNPLLRFTKDRRKNENSGGNDDDVNKMNHAKENRKVSIDHTVLSSEDSHQMMSSDVSPSSFEVDEVGHQLSRALPNNNRELIDAPNGYNVHYRVRPHSYSDQSYPAVSLCTCIDCCAQERHQNLSSRYPLAQGGGYGYVPISSKQPTHTHPPPIDPALQARIEAVKIQEQSLGISHPDVLFALSGIAKLYEKRGDHAQAANILKDCQLRSIMAKSAPQGSLNGSHHEKEDLPIEISFPH